MDPDRDVRLGRAVPPKVHAVEMPGKRITFTAPTTPSATSASSWVFNLERGQTLLWPHPQAEETR